MSQMSDYLETALANHILMGDNFDKPEEIAIALTSGVPQDSDDGSTIPEIPLTINGSGTGYARVSLDDPATSGDSRWAEVSGVVSIEGNVTFNTALVDWGWVSGIAILDNSAHGSGNLLFHSQLTNPRIMYTGDGPRINDDALTITFK